MKDFSRMVLVFLLAGIQIVFSQNKKEALKEITLNFDTESSSVSANDIQKMNAAIKELKGDLSSYSLEIAAHTDSNGSINYNNELSAKRAIASADFFVKKGFQNRKISFAAKGELHPSSDNVSETGRARNRRATVKIYQNNDTKNAIAGFSIEEKIYTIDTGNSQELVYESGTVIKIPENAFVDKNGNPVAGNVQVSYIEYRDPVDFIIGNIPMNHKQDGQDFHFNSAGMFKMLAQKDGEDVYLKKDKNIDIDFQLTENLPNLNFYEFVEKENKWKEVQQLSNDAPGGESLFIELGYYTIEESGDTISGTVTNRIVTNPYDNECQKSFRNLNIGLNFSKSDEAIYDPSLFISKDSLRAIVNKASINEIRLSKAKTKQNVLNDHQKKLNLLCVVENSPEANENQFTINVSNAIGLKVLKKIIWEGNLEELKGRKDTIILSNIEKVGDNNYTMYFKDGFGDYALKEIKIAPTTSINEKEQTSILKYANVVFAMFATKNEKFQLVIDKQKKHLTSIEEENKLIGKYTRIEAIRKNLTEFWEFNTTYMNKEEKNLNFEEWLQYFDAHKPAMLQRFTSINENEKFKECYRLAEEQNKKILKTSEATELAATVTQKLSISSLGIYNCDQIQRLQEPLIVNAQYENEQGEKIIPLFIYIVDKSINGILRYDGYSNYGPNRFAFSPKSPTTLLAFDGEGNAYIYSSEKMKTITSSVKEIEKKFTISKIENISNKEQLAALLH